MGGWSGGKCNSEKGDGHTVARSYCLAYKDNTDHSDVLVKS